MDKPEILGIVFQQVSRVRYQIKQAIHPLTDPLDAWKHNQQLPLRTLLACTLVSRQWHTTAHALIQRYQLADFEDQLETLRCFTLNKCVLQHRCRSSSGLTHNAAYTILSSLLPRLDVLPACRACVLSVAVRLVFFPTLSNTRFSSSI